MPFPSDANFILFRVVRGDLGAATRVHAALKARGVLVKDLSREPSVVRELPACYGFDARRERDVRRRVAHVAVRVVVRIRAVRGLVVRLGTRRSRPSRSRVMNAATDPALLADAAPRRADVRRDTAETKIAVAVDLDGTGRSRLASGVPFLDHMLDQIARHGLVDLDVEAHGDLHIDAHHTVEDIGITLGQAVARAVGDKKGIRRYGHAYVPLDEALSRVVIDFSGRPELVWHVPFTRAMIGAFDVDLAHEFFQGFVNHAQVTLHVDNLRGDNAHHQCETVFKAFGRALRMAAERDPRMSGVVPSTKGSL